MIFVYTRDVNAKYEVRVEAKDKHEALEKLHEGITYHVDTTKKHTALNAGRHLRFHIVFCLPSKDGRTENQLEFDLE